MAFRRTIKAFFGMYGPRIRVSTFENEHCVNLELMVRDGDCIQTDITLGQVKKLIAALREAVRHLKP